ncbi:glycoside hydrolase [Vibrio cholerae]|uniref:glycoside hydrolase n=1 Tax=Vibrio cholerae TaxID=666 RepID=UPI00307FDD36
MKLTFSSLGLLLLVSAPSFALTLEQGDQYWQIDPDTLAISLKQDSQTFAINQGCLQIDGQTQQATQVTQSAEQATWTLKPSGVQVSAQLQQGLNIDFRWPSAREIERQAPKALRWFDLSEASTQTLLLPFDEGMRVPTDNPTWTRYLIDNHSGANTTQDLKMPFWSAQQGEHFISYQLPNATNNQLHFSEQQNKLDLQAEHWFTPLNQSEPFSVRITVGDEMLAGAKAYRDWREAAGLRVSLAEKRKANPQIEKMIGASHVYLFGRDLIAVQDVVDWWGLRDWFWRSEFTPSPELQKELASLNKGQDWLNQYQKKLLVGEINQALNQKFSADPSSIQAQYQAAQQRKAWLTEHAGAYLKPSDQWGQGLAQPMISTLQQAGLSKLWLGLDNWMPAFYQPQVVDSAKQAGYLIGVYDSYNTAIEKGINDSWLTAQLPDRMRESCAIEKADGTLQLGFRGNGFYLNPACEFGYVKQRVQDILHFGRFNSLFLDVDGTAMAREDYRSRSNETAMLAAFNTRMQDIANTPKLILGSEDGNALTTQGLVLAHGMETVGFGWTDQAMKSDKQSPYYLGNWYPDEKPDFFFKSAQVKEPYRSLLFAPEYKVPLYQVVFHDELISSHHWHSDSLKFSNVKAVRDLRAMLFNTPAMVHLSRDEARKNSARIEQLKHYQQGFLPLHEQLWDKALVDFRWLDKQGQVQQTRYSDGSILSANFSAQPFKLAGGEVIAPHSLLAQLANGQTHQWQPK